MLGTCDAETGTYKNQAGQVASSSQETVIDETTIQSWGVGGGNPSAIRHHGELIRIESDAAQIGLGDGGYLHRDIYIPMASEIVAGDADNEIHADSEAQEFVDEWRRRSTQKSRRWGDGNFACANGEWTIAA